MSEWSKKYKIKCTVCGIETITGRFYFGEDIVDVCKSCFLRAISVKPVKEMPIGFASMQYPGYIDTPGIVTFSPVEKKIFVKEPFEWLCDEKGYTVPEGSTVMIEKLELSLDGKPFKVRGTRTYKKE